MITGRRLREKAAAVASGQPLPPPRKANTDIPRHQHEAALADLRKEHSKELASIRSELERSQAEAGELRAQLDELTAPTQKESGETAGGRASKKR